MFFFYIIDACFNLKENKRNIVFFLFFLTLSFLGIIIVDSMIFSVANKAEDELKVHNENTVTINFSKPIYKETIVNTFNYENIGLSFYKNLFLSVSGYPSKENQKQVYGVDEYFLSSLGVSPHEDFKGNVVIVDEREEYANNKQVFIGGIPFSIIGVKKIKKTDFLDSLGLNNGALEYKYLIPIETAFRLSLNEKINKVNIIFNDKISNHTIGKIKGDLDKVSNISYSITTFLDVKKTIDNVIERFGLLTNVIYIILNLLSVFFITSICKRNFQLRAKEFSLKIIHGIKSYRILIVVIIETIIVALSGAIFSVILAMLAIDVLSYILGVSLSLRMSMVVISFFVIFINSIFSNVIYGFLFFKKNPIEIIRW